MANPRDRPATTDDQGLQLRLPRRHRLPPITTRPSGGPLTPRAAGQVAQAAPGCPARLARGSAAPPAYRRTGPPEAAPACVSRAPASRRTVTSPPPPATPPPP